MKYHKVILVIIVGTEGENPHEGVVSFDELPQALEKACGEVTKFARKPLHLSAKPFGWTVLPVHTQLVNTKGLGEIIQEFYKSNDLDIPLTN